MNSERSWNVQVVQVTNILVAHIIIIFRIFHTVTLESKPLCSVFFSYRIVHCSSFVQHVKAVQKTAIKRIQSTLNIRMNCGCFLYFETLDGWQTTWCLILRQTGLLCVLPFTVCLTIHIMPTIKLLLPINKTAPRYI